MRKVILLILSVVALSGCFHEWPNTPIGRAVIFEGPLSGGGYIELGTYQNGIDIYYSEMTIRVVGAATVNGATDIFIDANGEHWILLDVAGVSGDIFTVEINGKIQTYEVI